MGNTDIPRKSFNEVLHDELTKLRPGKFDYIEPVGVTTAATSDREGANARRADNLRQLFGAIGTLTPAAKAADSEEDRGLSALCFSGGGIRSATFNLGILRTLAEHKLIRKFDYLSSVSGGGYIASWLRTWIWREGGGETSTDATPTEGKAAPPATPGRVTDPLETVETVLADNGANRDPLDIVETALADNGDNRDPLAPESRELDHLREFSNYLTPKLGLFSADTWTLAAIAIRNLLLNWLIILPALSIVTSLPLFVLLVVRGQKHEHGAGTSLLISAVGMALFASLATHMCRRFARSWKVPEKGVVSVCVVPTCAAASLLSSAALEIKLPDLQFGGLLGPEWMQLWEFSALWCVAVPLAGWLVAELAFLFYEQKFPNRSAWLTAGCEVLGLIVSGVAAGLLLVLLVRYAVQPLQAHAIAYSVLAFPALLALYLLARSIFVAFSGLAEHCKNRSFGAEDADREWWARLSGWVLMAAVMWLILSILCLYGTHLLRQIGTNDHQRLTAHGIVAALGGISGIVTALLGASSNTAGSEASKSKAKKPVWVDWVMALAAPLFAACVFVLVAQATIVLGEILINKFADTPHAFLVTDDGTHLQAGARRLFLIVPLACLLFIVFFGRIVNVNRFSLHGMYRNRLVRAYLGASNITRTPSPFTGFADDDNPSLHELYGPNLPLKPFPIINTALNLVKSGEKLAWQQRKAESFSMTPLYCGNFYEGYRSSKKYGGPLGISVGTAVTISGAAANPNMGSNSSPAISFLLAMFNLRLGAWLGNTNDEGCNTCGHTGPRHAFWPLVAELFGMTTSKNPYINLSDGGHFENLGLYEVVLRRCRTIVVCDAGCDPSGSFEDLGNAIRKIRIDFGIDVRFDQAIKVFPREAKKRGVYCAIGTVVYSKIDGPGAPDGRIVYIKPTLRARDAQVPYDVLSYAHGKPAFPHESTIDQFFSESQFESYRTLGAHSLAQIIGRGQPKNVRELIDTVDEYLRGPLPPGQGPAQKVNPPT